MTKLNAKPKKAAKAAARVRAKGDGGSAGVSKQAKKAKAR